jgi:hypothetical protein
VSVKSEIWGAVLETQVKILFLMKLKMKNKPYRRYSVIWKWNGTLKFYMRFLNPK